MPMIPMLLATALMAGGAAALGRLFPKKDPDYAKIPSTADPSVWEAGTAASRRARGASGQPDGMQWRSASQFTAAMPGLIGR